MPVLVSMEVVPETKMKGPFRTAREYPNLSSYGLEVLCLWVDMIVVRRRQVFGC